MNYYKNENMVHEIERLVIQFGCYIHSCAANMAKRFPVF